MLLKSKILNIKEAKEFIDMIKYSNFDNGSINVITDNLLTFLLLKFDAIIKNYESSSKKVKKEDYEQNTINFFSLMRNVAPLLNIMLALIRFRFVRERNFDSFAVLNDSNTLCQLCNSDHQ